MHATNKRMPARTTDVYRDAGVEPTLSDILSEPIVRILMARDAVSEEMLIEEIARARGRTFEAA